MKIFYSTLFIIVLLVYNTIIAIASPAYPGLIQKKQPDGSSISLYLKGDEKIHRMESEDGYSLLYDTNRTIVYAVSDEKGDMIPSSVMARDISMRSISDQEFLKNVSKKINYSKSQINTLSSIWEITQKTSDAAQNQFQASIEEARAICALIEFADKPLVKTKADFELLMNQIGYSVSGSKGSVKDYYLENSYGKLNLTITVAGPYKVSKNWAYYGENGADGNDIPARVQEFAIEAANLTFKDSGINPADYDLDGDGYIDAFHIIYAGYGEESGGDLNSIWAHKYGFPALTFGNKKLNTYSCSPELRSNSGNNITHIGVICHELCHIFGALDYYDTDDTGSGGAFTGTGNWDLMASGSWNNNGACPAHVNMYQKIQLGWVTPVVLTQPQIIANMPNSAMNPVAYRYDTSTTEEYFILENRQRTGFDQYVPGTGLLIYHVSITNADIRNNTVNTGHPQKVYPVCASANTNPNGSPASYGNINSSDCPFPGSSNKTSFTDYTIPSATAWNGSNTVKPLTEIQEQSGLVSFRFLMPDAEPVTNLQASVQNQNTVQLTWNKPSEEVTGYNIYRNNLLLIKLIGKNNTSYSQYNVSTGSYNYCITALYSGKESAPVCKTVQVTNSSVNGNSPIVQNLTAQNVNGNKDIELNWQSPFVSDWVSHANEITSWLYYTGMTRFVSAVRFTTEDLTNLYGSKLTKVRFGVYNTQCKHTIQVWLTDKDVAPGNNPIVNQTVNTFSAGIYEVILSSPVSLDNNKELWIGIQYELNPISHVVAIDDGPVAIRRNWINYNNQWQYLSAPAHDYNYYIAGYLQFNTLHRAPVDDWLRSTTATATNYVIYRDNVKIATTTQTHYIDSQPEAGNHIYCVSIAYDDGKESESVCVEAVAPNMTALDPVNNLAKEINIYPNPVKKGEDLIIHCDPDTDSVLSLYTITGQLIQQEPITESVHHKKMNFEPGIYLLQIKSLSNTFTRRIIIK